MIPSLSEADEAQASPDVIYSNGRYHDVLCYCRSANYRNRENGYRIGYARSNDLINWDRRDDLAGITVSSFGWDWRWWLPHVFQVNGETYMAYLGNGVGREGFGFARLWGIGVLLDISKKGKTIQSFRLLLPDGCVGYAQSPQALELEDGWIFFY